MCFSPLQPRIQNKKGFVNPHGHVVRDLFFFFGFRRTLVIVWNSGTSFKRTEAAFAMSTVIQSMVGNIECKAYMAGAIDADAKASPPHKTMLLLRTTAPCLGVQNGANNRDLRCVLHPYVPCVGCNTRLESRICKEVSPPFYL